MENAPATMIDVMIKSLNDAAEARRLLLANPDPPPPDNILEFIETTERYALSTYRSIVQGMAQDRGWQPLPGLLPAILRVVGKTPADFSRDVEQAAAALN